MGLPNIGPLELIIILAIALLIVGPRRLPEMGSAFGRTIREFRKASSEVSEASSLKVEEQPAAALPPVTAPPPAAIPTTAPPPASEPNVVEPATATVGDGHGAGQRQD